MYIIIFRYNLGFIQTYDRLRTFDFTRPFSQKGKVALYAQSGSSQDYSDLSGLKVGFLATWFSDEACLARYTTDPFFPIVVWIQYRGVYPCIDFT